MSSPSQINVALLGLGLMSRGMALRLLSGGFALTVYNRIAEKAARYLDLQPHEDIGKTSAGRVAATNAPHR